MSDPQVYQQLGALQARMKAVEKRSESMDGKLDTLLERSARERGGRGMLWKVGAISGAVGSLLMAIAQWWADIRGS